MKRLRSFIHYAMNRKLFALFVFQLVKQWASLESDHHQLAVELKKSQAHGYTFHQLISIMSRYQTAGFSLLYASTQLADCILCWTRPNGNDPAFSGTIRRQVTFPRLGGCSKFRAVSEPKFNINTTGHEFFFMHEDPTTIQLNRIGPHFPSREFQPHAEFIRYSQDIDNRFWRVAPTALEDALTALREFEAASIELMQTAQCIADWVFASSIKLPPCMWRGEAKLYYNDAYGLAPEGILLQHERGTSTLSPESATAHGQMHLEFLTALLPYIFGQEGLEEAF